MRVYYPGQRNNHTMYVAPAADPRLKGEASSDWITEKGEPITFEVCFKNGAAMVPDSLGRYLIRTGLAKRTRLILPAGFIDRAA